MNVFFTKICTTCNPYTLIFGKCKFQNSKIRDLQINRLQTVACTYVEVKKEAQKK